MHVVSAFAFFWFPWSSRIVTLASVEEWLSYVEGCGHCFLRVVQPVGFGELLPSSLGPQRGLDTRKVWGLSTTADLDLQ